MFVSLIETGFFPGQELAGADVVVSVSRGAATARFHQPRTALGGHARSLLLQRP